MNTKEAESVHWLLDMNQTELAYLGGEQMTFLQETVVFIDLGGGKSHSRVSFFQNPSCSFSIENLPPTPAVNKLVPVLARKCFILYYIYG